MNLYVWRYVVKDARHYTENEPEYVCEKVIDDWISLIWCERAQKAGEFKLILNATPELLNYFVNNELLISRNDSDRAMIPEIIRLKTSRKNGDRLEISGKSAEGLLQRRTIEQKGSPSDSIVNLVNYYMQENIASYWYYHSDSDHQHGVSNPYCRRYVNMLEHGADDDRIDVNATVEPFGINLGSFVEQCCKAGNFCFKAVFDSGKLHYSCYKGYDRSINQVERNPVIFSKDYDNLGDTEFEYSKLTKYNHVIVGGGGKGSSRAVSDRFSGFRTVSGVGLNMREGFVNASENSDDVLSSIAANALASSSETINFTGEALSGGKFKYRADYFLGDTVTVKNPYGITGSAVISEVVETVDATGYRVIPTFTEWRIDENDGTD